MVETKHRKAAVADRRRDHHAVVEMVRQIPASGLLPSASDDGIASTGRGCGRTSSTTTACWSCRSRVRDRAAGTGRSSSTPASATTVRSPASEALTLGTPFLTDLADAGFPREEVDTVVCTHLHFDHVGWNTMLVDGEWIPTFPNARYVLCRGEWAHWSSEEAPGTRRPSTTRCGRSSTQASPISCRRPSGHRRDPARADTGPHAGHVAVHVESGGSTRHHRRSRAPPGAVRRARLVRRPRHRPRQSRPPVVGCCRSTATPTCSSSALTSCRRVPDISIASGNGYTFQAVAPGDA